MRLRLAALAAAAALVLTGCAGDDLAKDGAVRIASQAFPEADLVSQMYVQVLEDNGYSTELKLVDTRDVYMKTFPGGTDIVPEYVGAFVEYLNTTENGADAKPIATAGADDSIEAAKSLIDAQGVTLLEPSAATDTNAFFMTEERARKLGVAKLSDLKGKKLVLAAAPDCEGRSDCERGLIKTYGIDITKVLPLGFASAQTYKAVIDGEADLGLTSTTDGTLESQGLVLLEDDLKIQTSQHLVPAVSDKFLADNPEVEALLNDLMAALTTDKLIELNGRVSVDREKPEDVARDFLEAEGLLD
jgi:osmoprotectant transport system substrate-binding protein